MVTLQMMAGNAWIGTNKAKKETGDLLTVTSKDLAKRVTFGLLSHRESLMVYPRGWLWELLIGLV